MIEWLDIYDNNLNYRGIKARDAVHRDGDWHHVFQCWVVAFWNDELHLIMQKRAHDKDIFPNLLDVSAAGHLSEGENMRDAVRELEEEIGLEVPFNTLQKIALRRYETRLDNIIDREFATIYMVACNQPLADYRPDPVEVADLVSISLSTFIELFTNQSESVQAESYHDGTITLTQADFVPNDVPFYATLGNHLLESWAIMQLENPLAIPKILKFGF